MSKEIRYDAKAREAILRGVRTLADASVASIMLTTQAMISEKPDKTAEGDGMGQMMM